MIWSGPVQCISKSITTGTNTSQTRILCSSKIDFIATQPLLLPSMPDHPRLPENYQPTKRGLKQFSKLRKRSELLQTTQSSIAIDTVKMCIAYDASAENSFGNSFNNYLYSGSWCGHVGFNVVMIFLDATPLF